MNILILRKLFPYMLLAFGLGAFLIWFWNTAHQSGMAKVQAEWNQEKTQRQAEIDQLKLVIKNKESDHATENRRLNTELAKANESAAVALATARGEFADRLRGSEKRVLVYQRQAESGAAECRSLASHAAKLDRALEEGRSLEQEYRTTLGQRDNEIRALSAQILNDRQLLN